MRVKQVQACRPKDDGPSLDRPMRRKPARNAFSRDRSNYPPSPIAVPLAWLYPIIGYLDGLYLISNQHESSRI